MIFWRQSKSTKPERDEALLYLLTRDDPLQQPSQSYLSSLEDKIISHVSLQPDPRKQSFALRSVRWVPATDWMLRGAVAGVVFILLGFLAGQELQSFDPDNEAPVFVGSNSVPLTSLIHSPLAAGDADDADE